MRFTASRRQLRSSDGIAAQLRAELFAHIPALNVANVRFESADLSAAASAPGRSAEHAHSGHNHPHPHGAHGHHHAPEPFRVDTELAQGTLEIVDTANGERMRLRLARGPITLEPSVIIRRPSGPEALVLEPTLGAVQTYQSRTARVRRDPRSGQFGR